MDLDEQQQFKHGLKTLVGCADMMRAEIQKHPFSEPEAEKMLLTYWQALINSSFTPDIKDIMEAVFKRDE